MAYRFLPSRKYISLLGLVMVLILISLIVKDSQRPAGKKEFISVVSPYEEADIASLPMDDLRLVAHLKDRFLILPPARFVQRVLNRAWIWNHATLAQFSKVVEILGDQYNGFFVEFGSHRQTEPFYNSLQFEVYYKWTGLLIEENPVKFYDLVLSRRQAFLSPTCLSDDSHPKVIYLANKTVAAEKSMDYRLWMKPASQYLAQCFPLYTYLVAMNRTTIDYFSLDIERDVLSILKTIPWSQVKIRVLRVDTANINGGQQDLQVYLKERGFSVYSKVFDDKNTEISFIFNNLSES